MAALLLPLRAVECFLFGVAAMGGILSADHLFSNLLGFLEEIFVPEVF